jgi:hypothetical protein
MIARSAFERLSTMTRRRFAFWLSFGLFSLADKLRIYGLDELAAATLRAAEPATTAQPVHWRAADNLVWQWYERETFIDGRWVLTGITTPVNKETGERYMGQIGYLDESLVPESMRLGYVEPMAPKELGEFQAEFSKRKPSPKRQARHGRPPSKWLRSLNADELRIWLKTIEVPEAGVSGMTYWTHLTRDHSFDPVKIEGLTEDELAKLHGAAHFGY